MSNLKEVLQLLEERLVQHDKNREVVQSQLQEACAKIVSGTNSLEEKINADIHKDFVQKEERILALIEKLNEEGRGDWGELIKQAKEELSKGWKYEIQQCDQKKKKKKKKKEPWWFV